MKKLLGIRFGKGGKTYTFEANGENPGKNSKVVVETSRGMELGTVTEIQDIPSDEEDIIPNLRPIIRLATEEDLRTAEEIEVLQKQAYDLGRKKIEEHGLDMKLVTVEYTFDKKKIVFFFTSEGRVDFRELVRDLSSEFRARIELRQIGVRDSARMLGGIGVCGREFCCCTYMSEFNSVSVRMAKVQNLSLNPAKISGACGRLMCCLMHEEETYRHLHQELPSVGETVVVPEGVKATVSQVNLLRGRIRVLVNLPGDEREMREYPAEETLYLKKLRAEKPDGAEEAWGRILRSAADVYDEKKPPVILESITGDSSKGSKNKQEDSSRRKDRSRSDRGDRPDRNDRNDRSERGEKGDKPAQGDKNRRNERNNRSDKSDRGERNDRNGKKTSQRRDGNRPNPNKKQEGFEKKDRPPRPQKRDKAEGQGDNSSRRENTKADNSKTEEGASQKKRPRRRPNHRKKPQGESGNGPQQS